MKQFATDSAKGISNGVSPFRRLWQLRQSDLIITSGVIAAIVWFEGAVYVQFLLGMHLLALSIAFGGLLLSFALLIFIKTRTRTAYIKGSHMINVAELLGRDTIPLHTPEAYTVLKGQVILVTGAAGSIGSELCRQLLDYEPECVIALDNNETGLFDLAEDLRTHPCSILLHTYICDIKDKQRIARFFAERRPRIVFHAAAYKHVPLLEYYPDQAVQTNILATYHLCCLAQEYHVAHFIFISTDKAANPLSVMGASKRVGEMVVQSLAKLAQSETCFYAVRFGNVIGSRGSVVPVFAQQIERGGPVTVTHPDATRYFMTIAEACELVIVTAAFGNQGGLYLLDMGKPVRINDLAMRMIRSHGLREGRDIAIVYTGLRAGDRLYEDLVASNEELKPTNFNKIFCVTSREELPTLVTIAQWIDALERSVQHENTMQIRERLFGIIRQRELTATN